MDKDTKKRIAFCMASAIFSVNLCANIETPTSKADVNENIIRSAAHGENVVSASNQQEVKKKEKESFYDYRDEVLLGYYYAFQSAPVHGSVAKNIKGAVKAVDTSPPSGKNGREGKENKKSNTINLRGFCIIPHNIKIGKQPGALMAECQTNHGAVKMFANLKALNAKEALIVDPLYVVAPSGTKYKVKKSIVTNATKTSYNIATWVNTQKLEKAKYRTISLSSDEIKAASNEYLKALEQSKTKIERVVPSGGSYTETDSPVISGQETQPPDAATYAIKAGINIVAAAAKGISETLASDLPYLYTVAEGTRIYVDMTIDKTPIK